MSGRGKDRGPPPPKVGYPKAMLFVLPAMAVAYSLYSFMTQGQGSSSPELFNLGMILSVTFLGDPISDARPAAFRQWAILLATALAGGAASGFVATGAFWLFRPSDDWSGATILGAIGLAGGCSLAVYVTLWTASRLTRADSLIFPKDAEEDEGGAG